MGDVVLAELLAKKGLLPSDKPSLDLFLIIEDESLRASTLELAQQARDSDFSAEYSFNAVRGDKQFKKALELGARHTAKIDPDNPSDIVIRSLVTREDMRATQDNWIAELVKLSKGD